MNTITLTNDFHNTSTNVRAHFLSHGAGEFSICLTKNQAKRAARALCGLKDCTCGGFAGQRGPQTYGSDRFSVERFRNEI